MKSTAKLRPKYAPVLHDGEIIAAFDPGLTTGAVLVRYLGGLDKFDVLNVVEILWQQRFASVQGLVAQADHIVVESFRLYADKAEDQINNSFPSAQVIGVIDTWAWSYLKLEQIVEQPASEISRVEILSRHVELVRGSEHKKDAYKHARRFITMNYSRK